MTQLTFGEVIKDRYFGLENYTRLHILSTCAI